MDISATDILKRKGVKPTSNRILVMNALLHSSHPLSLADIESRNLTMDKSSIFRALTLFKEHDLVHVIEDGSGSLKYELCQGDHHDGVGDMHVHFYCEVCQKTYCLNKTEIPMVNMPSGFLQRSVNYIVKGICPSCQQ